MSNIKYFLFAILLIAFLPACKSSKKTASAGKTNDITKFKNLGVTDNTKEVIVLPGDLQSIDEYVKREKAQTTGIDQKSEGKTAYYVKGKLGSLIIVGTKSSNDTLKEKAEYYFRDGQLVYIETNRISDRTSFWNTTKKYYIVDNNVKEALIQKIDTRKVTFGQPATEPYVKYESGQNDISKLLSDLTYIRNKYEFTAPFTGMLLKKDGVFTLTTCVDHKVVNINDVKKVLDNLWLSKNPAKGSYIYVGLNGMFDAAKNTLVPSGYTMAEVQGGYIDCLK